MPTINYYYENNHKRDISLDEYIKKYNNHSLIKLKCEDCNKTQNEGDYHFCCKCNKFLCHICLLNHPNYDKHNTININRYDSFCKIHSNFLIFFV